MTREWELLAPHTEFPGGERSWSLNPSPMANDVINHACVNEASITPPKNRAGRVCGVGEHGETRGERCTWGESGSCWPFPVVCTMCLFHLAVPFIIYPSKVFL